jgi:hypothetical protein
MLVPHQVVRHKSVLSNVTKHLILRQHPSISTPIARALRFMMLTSKSWLQKILCYLKPFGRVYTVITESVIHQPFLILSVRYTREIDVQYYEN